MKKPIFINLTHTTTKEVLVPVHESTYAIDKEDWTEYHFAKGEWYNVKESAKEIKRIIKKAYKKAKK